MERANAVDVESLQAHASQFSLGEVLGKGGCLVHAGHFRPSDGRERIAVAIKDFRGAADELEAEVRTHAQANAASPEGTPRLWGWCKAGKTGNGARNGNKPNKRAKLHCHGASTRRSVPVGEASC